MQHQQVIEGTSEEIQALLQSGVFAGQRLWLVVGSIDEDFGDGLPAPSHSVRSQAHLEELLLEALSSPKEEVTDSEWIEMRREVRERLAQRRQ